MSPNKKSYCHTLTFPFWIYVDEANPPPNKSKFIFKGLKCHIYKPYRTAPANFINMPIPTPFSMLNFSFTDSKYRSANLPWSLAQIPRLDRDAEGKAQLSISFKEKWNKRPNPFPMDSLRIDIEYNSDYQKEIIQELSNKFIKWTRIITKQWWIDRSSSSMIGYLRHYIRINKNGEICSSPTASVNARTVEGHEKPLDNKNWEIILKKLKANEEWFQHDIFLLDSQYLLANDDFRGSLMNLSLTMETYSEFTFKRLWDNRATTSFKKNSVMKGDNFIAFITDDLDRFISESYKKVNNNLIGELEDLLFLRNRIAHGQSPELLKNSTWHSVNEDKVKTIRSAVNHCINWLDSLK